MGDKNTLLLIEELSTYIASTSKGKKYTNHYATLLGWARRKVETRNEKTNSRNKSIAIIQ